MTHASIFSGIGGFDLAAEWAGWTNAFNCEIDPFCQQVLKYHFPNATQYSDIKTTDFTFWRGRIDVLSGGFPCQPFSLAGKRKGTDDDRYLWPQMLRAIREIQPRWVVGENVLGIVSWSNGMVFEQVCADLEVEGYEVQPYALPACGVDAPHRRYRVWFVAHRTDAGTQGVRKRADGVHAVATVSDTHGHRSRIRQNEQESIGGSCGTTYNRLNGKNGDASDADSVHGRYLCRQKTRKEAHEVNSYSSLRNRWENFPTQSPVCGGDDGVSDRLYFDAVFAGVSKPRRAKADGRWKMHSIKAYGNAIVPQVALQIFETINEYEKTAEQ